AEVAQRDVVAVCVGQCEVRGGITGGESRHTAKLPGVTERTADEIQKDIERSRTALAKSVDALAYRTSPERIKDMLREKANSTQGRIVIGVAGGIAVLLIIKRFRKR